MTLPAAITDAVTKAAAKEIAGLLADRLEDLELFTFHQVAERLKVSEPTARRLIHEHVELGEASKRVTAGTLRRLIEARTISKT
jgi:Fic family protein